MIPLKRIPLAGLVAAVLAATAPAAAHAFDTGPHADQTVDAMLAEGFGQPAADVARVNNWLVDFYANAELVPFSDKGDLDKVIAGGGLGNREHWPTRVVKAAKASHMDSAKRVVLEDGTVTSLKDVRALEAEWDRLRLATAQLVHAATESTAARSSC
jgi:hypothetical protein